MTSAQLSPPSSNTVVAPSVKADRLADLPVQFEDDHRFTRAIVVREDHARARRSIFPTGRWRPCPSGGNESRA